MLNSLNSIAHQAIRPDRSGLCIVLLRGKFGENDNRVCLEIRAEFFGCYPEGQRRLLETSVSSFYLDKDLLTKNKGLYYLCSSSLNEATLTET